MKRWFEISSLRDGLYLCALITLGTVTMTLLASELFSYALEIATDRRQYILRAVIPLLLTPAVVIPLVRMNLRLNRMRDEMDVLARTDVLTGLPNRRAFFAHANEVFAQQAGRAPAAVLMVDVDHFKAINDTFGHDAGDAVLEAIAHTIRAVSAQCGAGRALAARIGGEEFAIVIGGSDAIDASALAASICDSIRAAVITRGVALIRTTASIGVALRRDGEPIDAVLKEADTAAYRAKESGRDRWVMADGPADAARSIARALRAQPRAA